MNNSVYLNLILKWTIKDTHLHRVQLIYFLTCKINLNTPYFANTYIQYIHLTHFYNETENSFTRIPIQMNRQSSQFESSDYKYNN